MALRVALFINYTAVTYSQTDQILSDVVHYSGQRKRKTFDGWFAPEKETNFYLFYRNIHGWNFVGKAHSVSQIKSRTENAPPVWALKVSQHEMTRNKVSQNELKPETLFVSKEMVLKKCGLVSKYKSMATGIIPLENV